MTGYFKSLWKQVKSPKKTLAVVVRGSDYSCTWGSGTLDGKQAMHVVGRLTATNISKLGVLPTSAMMRKPKLAGQVITKKHDEITYGEYIISPGHITNLMVTFWISPPIKEKGETFTADIAVVDQFDNHHWIEKVAFQSSSS